MVEPSRGGRGVASPDLDLTENTPDEPNQGKRNQRQRFKSNSEERPADRSWNDRGQ
jgi:hypothetical protein